MRRSTLASLGALLVVAACSNGPKPGADAGDASADGPVKPDGAPVDGGATCPTPQDVAGFVPPLLPPPTGKHLGKCTQGELDTYHLCVLHGDNPSCSTIKTSAATDPWKSCLECLEGSQYGDPAWGPLYCNVGGQLTACLLNQEGCVELATGQTGPMSCGQLLHASYTCQLAACGYGYCGTDQAGFAKCVQAAVAGACKMYVDAVPAGCFDTDPDGGYPEIANCFNADRVALRTSIDTYFCGP